MSELTNLEICKRLADIEDVSYFEFPDCIVETSNPDGSGTPQEALGVYNPLTDDALCFRLMVKYSITFHKSEQENPEDVFYTCCSTRSHNLKHTTYSYESPNKAICLAIIKANNP